MLPLLVVFGLFKQKTEKTAKADKAEKAEKRPAAKKDDAENPTAKLGKVKAAILNLKALSIDFGNVEKLLSEAKAALDSNDHAKGAHLAEKCSEEFENCILREVQKGETIIDILDSFDEASEKAKGALAQSKAAYEQKKYKTAVDIARQIEAAFKDRVVDLLGEAGKDATNAVAELEKSGFEVAKLKEIVESSKKMLSEGNVRGAFDGLNSVEKGIDELKAQEEKLKATIAALRAKAEHFKKLGCDTQKIDDEISSIESLIPAKKFSEVESSSARLDDTLESHKKSQAETKKAIEALEARIVEQSGKGISCAKALEELEAAKGAAKKMEFETAKAHITASSEAIDDVVNKHKAVFEKLNKVRARMEYAKEKGGFAPEAEIVMTESFEAHSKMDYDTALIKADVAIKLLDEAAEKYKGAEQDIARAKAAIEGSKQTGGFSKVAQQSLQSAMQALIDCEYAKSSAHAKEAIDAIETSITKYKKASETLLNASARMKATGGKPHEARACIDKAKAHISAFEYEDALAQAEKCMALVSAFEEKSAHVIAKLDEASKKIEEMRALGTDSEKANALMSSAAEFYDKNDFESAMKSAQGALDESAKHIERFTSAQKVVVDIEKDIGDALALGAPVGEISAKFDKVKSDMAHCDFDAAIKNALTILNEANECLKEPAQKRIGEAKAKIEEIYATGFESEDAMAGLERADKHLSEGQYIKAFVVSAKVATETEQAFALCQEAAEKLLATQECMGSVKALGGDVAEAEKLVADGEACIMGRDYRQARDLAVKALEMMHDAGLALIKDTLESGKGMVALAEKMGADITRSKPFLLHSQSLVNAHNFEKARDMAILCKQEAKWAISQMCSERASRTSNILSDAKLLGVDCTKSEAHLQQANEHLSKEEFEQAYDMFEVCQDEIGDLVRNHLADELTESSKRLETATLFGVDVAPMKALEAESEQLLEKGEFRAAKKKVEECIVRAESGINLKIASIFSNARSKIDDARYFSVNVQTAEAIIESARPYVEKKDYGKILEDHAKFEKELLDASRGKYLELTADALTLIGVLEKFHFDVRETLNKISEGENAIAALDIRNGFTSGIKAVDTAKAMLLSNVKETINQVEQSLRQAQDIGVRDELKAVEVSVQDMKLFFQSSEWEEGFKKAEVCQVMIKEALHGHLSKMIDRAQTLLDTLKSLGGDASNLASVEKALEDLETGDYESGVKNARACLDQCEAAVIHTAAVKMSKLEGKVEFAKGLGMDCSNASAALAAARLLVESGEYAKFIGALRKCAEELVVGGKALFQKKLDDTVAFLSDVETRLGHPISETPSVPPPSDGLEEASKKFSEGDLKGALERLDAVKASLNDGLGEFASSAVAKLDARLSSALALGANEELAESRKMLDESKAALDSREYWKVLDAEKRIDKGISDAVSKHVTGEHSRAKAMVQALTDLGLDSTSERKTLDEGEEYVAKCEYQEALSKFSKCYSDARTRVDKKRDEIFAWFESCKDVAAEIELDAAFVSELLDKSRALSDKGDYAGVLAAKKECESGIRAGAEEKHRTVKAGGLAMLEIITSRNIGDGSLAKDLESSDKMLSEGQFKEALSLAADVVFRSKEMLDNSLSDRFTRTEVALEEIAGLGLSEPQAKVLLEESRVLQSNMEYEGAFSKMDMCAARIRAAASAKVENEQKRAGAFSKLAKRLIKSPTEADSDFDESRKMLSEMQFKGAYDKALSAQSKFETALKSALSEEIRLARNELSQSSALGVANLEGYKDAIDESERLLASRQYEDCYHVVTDARHIIDTKIEEQIRIEIESAREVLTTALKFKIKSKKADELLNESEKKMEQKEYPESKVLARLAAEECNKQVKLEAQETLEVSRNLIASSTKMGVDMKKAQKMLERAEKLFWESNYLMVFDAAKTCIEEAQNTVKEYIARLLTECGNMISGAGKVGIDTREYALRLSEVEMSYVGADYGKAMKVGIALFDEVVKVVRGKCETTIDAVRKGLGEAESDGYKLAKTSKYLEAAKKELDGKKLLSAAELAAKAEKSLRDEREEIWIDAMMDAKNLVEEAKGQKFNVPEAEELLSKSKFEFASKHYKPALELAREAKRACGAAFGEYKKAFDAIDSVTKLLEEASKICDVKTVKRALRMATQSMGANDYAKAHEIAKACEKELDKLQYKALAERLKVAGSEVGEIIAFGADAEDAKKLLVDARNYIKDRSFAAAHECLDAISAFVAKEHARRSVLTALRNAESLINDRTMRGFDMTTAKRLLDKAKELEQSGDMKKALEYAQNAEINAKVFDTNMM